MAANNSVSLLNQIHQYGTTATTILHTLIALIFRQCSYIIDVHLYRRALLLMYCLFGQALVLSHPFVGNLLILTKYFSRVDPFYASSFHHRILIEVENLSSYL